MAVLAVVAAILVPGGRDVQPAGASAAARPAWTKACWSSPPRNDRRLLERCVRVTGRVLWIRREGPDPEDKAHVMMASGLRLVLARYEQAGIHRLPGIGHSATIIGPLVRSRSGLDEVQVFAEA
ncbi:MAG TPA: hypothetical protein VEX67_00295 [Solirubrobacteraceae bacterium]|nr:hypothetical protein [Solirubrobacteraceae bacterium]